MLEAPLLALPAVDEAAPDVLLATPPVAFAADCAAPAAPAVAVLARVPAGDDRARRALAHLAFDVLRGLGGVLAQDRGLADHLAQLGGEAGHALVGGLRLGLDGGVGGLAGLGDPGFGGADGGVDGGQAAGELLVTGPRSRCRGAWSGRCGRR